MFLSSDRPIPSLIVVAMYYPHEEDCSQLPSQLPCKCQNLFRELDILAVMCGCVVWVGVCRKQMELLEIKSWLEGLLLAFIL